MGRSTPIPENLHGRALTPARLAAHGISVKVLRRKDIVHLGSGIYSPESLLEGLDDDDVYRLRATTLTEERPGSWLSHSTAARFNSAPLPLKLARDPTVHISVPSGRTRPRTRDVTGHRETPLQGHITSRSGIAMSTPSRMWVELARYCSVRDLVVLGDWLVRSPYPAFEQRSRPYSTIESLGVTLSETPAPRNADRARRALRLIRRGADSRLETLLRLALRESGLPEPELQVPADPRDPRSPRGDLDYPQWKIVIQYDGETHFSANRHRADIRRDNVFWAAGWIVLRFHVDDFREGFGAAVEQVRQAIAVRHYQQLEP